MAAHQGSCLCGGVRYEVDAALGPIYLCHCQRCRKAHGGAFAAVVMVPKTAFHLLAGEERLTQFGSGDVHRIFCRVCGSPIYSRRDSMPDVLRLRAGLLDTPIEGKPAMHIFVASKATWFDIHDDAPQYAERA